MRRLLTVLVLMAAPLSAAAGDDIHFLVAKARHAVDSGGYHDAIELAGEATEKLKKAPNPKLSAELAAIYKALRAPHHALNAARLSKDGRTLVDTQLWFDSIEPRYAYIPGSLDIFEESWLLLSIDQTLDEAGRIIYSFEAYDVREGLAEDYPKQAATQQLLCLVAFDQERFDQARDHCAKAVEYNPNSTPRSRFRLARLALQTGSVRPGPNTAREDHRAGSGPPRRTRLRTPGRVLSPPRRREEAHPAEPGLRRALRSEAPDQRPLSGPPLRSPCSVGPARRCLP